MFAYWKFQVQVSMFVVRVEVIKLSIVVMYQLLIRHLPTLVVHSCIYDQIGEL